MSNIGIHQYKRAVLYDQIKAAHQQHAIVTADWFNSTAWRHIHPTQKNKGVLIALAIVTGLHLGVWYLSEQFKTQPLLIKKPEPVVIEIIKPKEDPPKIIKPKIPPITKKVEIPPIQPKPVPVSKPVEKPAVVKVASTKPVQSKPIEQPVVQEKITAPVKQVVPESPAEKAAPPVTQNLPVSEAKGYAGYLSNPAPEYPEIALERGWEGSVLLRVKVSAFGHPLSVEVKQGSGKKALDDAALRTVKRWKFSPAMRGSTAIEGWVDVPINFKLPA
ncbi:energy transducer TonB [Acinetobacter sp. ANC 5378]|uniref:energy transducer TonB n=1 Tax=Acinetobacter sp. ANC 5378 TaxID=2731249 RepID=UPI00148F6661|nr:energy transducer TonB [Acinetobacter sp. ANC 5378]NNG81600.1 energy transducer TonB [Acinetobacter sp. ANC 5378]